MMFQEGLGPTFVAACQTQRQQFAQVCRVMIIRDELRLLTDKLDYSQKAGIVEGVMM